MSLSITSTVVKDRNTVEPDYVNLLTYPAYAAHRGGDPGPEETMRAYQAAELVGPQVLLEMDILTLADGTLVLNHDDTIDRMASSTSPITTGNVNAFTAAQWATLLWHENSVTTGAYPAAFWSDILASYKSGSRLLMPEIKNTTARTGLIQSILDNQMKGKCIVQGFGLSDVQAASAAGLHTIYLSNTPTISTLVSSGIGHVGIDYATLTGGTGATIVSDAHAAGIKVWVYTVNNTSNRNTALGLGADAFFTNVPAALV
jgi:glycerophosphoryl diester phosphodiesterase